MGKQDDGRGKCSFDPTQSFTTVMVGEWAIGPSYTLLFMSDCPWCHPNAACVRRPDGELYSGTAYNFLGSEPIISRFSRPQSLLRTEYSTSWLNGTLPDLTLHITPSLIPAPESGV